MAKLIPKLRKAVPTTKRPFGKITPMQSAMNIAKAKKAKK